MIEVEFTLKAKSLRVAHLMESDAQKFLLGLTIGLDLPSVVPGLYRIVHAVPAGPDSWKCTARNIDFDQYALTETEENLPMSKSCWRRGHDDGFEGAEPSPPTNAVSRYDYLTGYEVGKTKRRETRDAGRPDNERRRLEKAQQALNVTWISAAVGTLSTLLGMTLNVPIALTAPWLILCAVTAVAALVWSIVVSLLPVE